MPFEKILPELEKAFLPFREWYIMSHNFVYSDKTHELIPALNNSEDWNSIHEITEEKCLASDPASPGFTLLLAAVLCDNKDAVDKILKSKNIANIINQTYYNDFSKDLCTPISIAIERGNLHIVKALLNSNLIDISQSIYKYKDKEYDIFGYADKFSMTPNHDEIFTELLKYKGKQQNTKQQYTQPTTSPANPADVLNELKTIIDNIKVKTYSTNSDVNYKIQSAIYYINETLKTSRIPDLKLLTCEGLVKELNDELKKSAGSKSSPTMYSANNLSPEFLKSFEKVLKLLKIEDNLPKYRM